MKILYLQNLFFIEVTCKLLASFFAASFGRELGFTTNQNFSP